MKSLQNLISPRKLSLIQSIASLVIMLAIVIMSFGTIFTAKVEKTADMVESFNEMVENMGGKKVEIPTEVEFSAPGIISSIGSLGKVLKGAIDTAKDAADLSKSSKEADDIEDIEKLEEKAEKTKDSAKNMADGMQGLANFIAMILIMVEAFKQSVILGLIYLALISMTLLLPIILAITFLTALIPFLKNLQEPEAAYPKIAKKFGSMFGSFVVLLLLKAIAPEVTFGGVITGIVVLCAIGFVLNIVASRMKPATDLQTKFLNVNQIVSLAGFGAFMMFFTALKGTNLFNRIWERLDDFALDHLSKEDSTTLLLSMAMIFVMIVVLFSICSYLQKVCCRMACMVKTGKVATRDNYIVSTALALLVVIIPVVLMKGEYALKLNDEEMGAFTLFAIGVVLMLVVEIVYAVLKKALCKGLSHEDVVAVLSGVGAEEAPAVEEAPAEEAAPAAEEAPATENSAQE